MAKEISFSIIEYLEKLKKEDRKNMAASKKKAPAKKKAAKTVSKASAKK